ARNQEIEAQAVAQPALDALKKLNDAVTKAENKDEKGEQAETEVAKAAADEAKEKPDEKPADKPADEAAEKAAPADDVKNGMHRVSYFADLLQAIQCWQQDTEWEAEWEGDNSELPAKLKAWLAQGGELLVQMAGEETAELTASKAAGGDLAKKGAKLSTAN